MWNALDDVDGAGAYDQLTMYNSIFMLLNDQRYSMASVNVNMEDVLDLFDTLYRRSQALTVQKEQSKNLQQEMVKHYEGYREDIERAFSNAAERG